jgi:chaperone required for assembly of F1-ATPase
MAEAVAAEWEAQDGEIKPLTMPVTRSANSAIERVTPNHAEVAAMLAAYGETDLLCYRADGPQSLVERQAEGWDPLLDWAAQTYGARLRRTVGVLPVDQPAEAIETLSRKVAATPPFHLTALHDLVTLSGSLILGLATAEGRLDPKTAFDLSRIDEDFQIEQWGEDEEASAFAASRLEQFQHAHRFWTLASDH